MLKAMRKSVQSTFVKVFLFGLLIISFGLWGVTDLFVQNPNQQVVATIAEEELDYLTFAQLYQQQIRQTGIQLAPEDIDPALNRIFEQSILDNWSFDILLREEVKRLRLAVSEDQLRASIVQNPAFRDTEGNFSRRLFENFLASRRMAEPMYLQSIRINLAQNLLIQSLLQGVGSPSKIMEYTQKYNNSYRRAKFLEIVASPLMNIPAPSNHDIQTFYDQNKNNFQLPENRSVKLLEISLDRLAENIEPNEEDLQDYYAENRVQLLTPENRRVERILFDDEDTARKAWVALQEGKSFVKVAETLAGLDKVAIQLGEITRENYADQLLADTAFRLPLNEVSEPFEGIFGWMIIRTIHIIPEHAPSFSELRVQLSNELKQEKANELIFDYVDQIEDLIASGATIEEISAEVELSTESRRFAIGEENVEALLASQAESLEKVGDKNLFEASNGGYRLLELVEIMPERVPELSEIRSEVEVTWYSEQQRARALEQADALALRLNNGANIDDLALDLGLTVRQTEAINRDGSALPQSNEQNLGNFVMPEFAHIPMLFSLEENNAVAINSEQGAQVLLLGEVIHIDSASHEAYDNTTEDQLRNLLSTEAFTALVDALKDQYPLTVNRAVIDQLYIDLSNPQPLHNPYYS